MIIRNNVWGCSTKDDLQPEFTKVLKVNISGCANIFVFQDNQAHAKLLGVQT